MRISDWSSDVCSSDLAWRRHDAVALIEDGARVPELLVDQGAADQFLDGQLQPHRLRDACDAAGIGLTLSLHEGYDHSYYFISTFMETQLRRSEEHTSEIQSLMRISYAVFCLTKKKEIEK